MFYNYDAASTTSTTAIGQYQNYYSCCFSLLSTDSQIRVSPMIINRVSLSKRVGTTTKNKTKMRTNTITESRRRASSHKKLFFVVIILSYHRLQHGYIFPMFVFVYSISEWVNTIYLPHVILTNDISVLLYWGGNDRWAPQQSTRLSHSAGTPTAIITISSIAAAHTHTHRVSRMHSGQPLPTTTHNTKTTHTHIYI